MSRWQGGLERKQTFLGRIVDIGAELFAMTAVCVRAEEDSRDLGRRPMELADVFCRQARIRVDTLFDRLWHNSDAHDARVAGYVLDGRYTFVEEGILDPSVEGPWIAAPAEGEDVHRHVQ